MSHYATIGLKIKDKQSLLDALREEFGYVEDYEVAKNLVGYQGDTREQVANIIVRRQHIDMASNDLGFVKNSDGTYSMLISNHDRGSICNTRLKKVLTNYTVRLIKRRHASKYGVEVKNGKIILTVRG